MQDIYLTSIYKHKKNQVFIRFIKYIKHCFFFQHLHIWDLYEECLLQTVKIKFPFLGVLGKKVEFGTYCIHPGKSMGRSSIIIINITRPVVAQGRKV